MALPVTDRFGSPHYRWINRANLFVLTVKYDACENAGLEKLQATVTSVPNASRRTAQDVCLRAQARLAHHRAPLRRECLRAGFGDCVFSRFSSNPLPTGCTLEDRDEAAATSSTTGRRCRRRSPRWRFSPTGLFRADRSVASSAACRDAAAVSGRGVPFVGLTRASRHRREPDRPWVR